MKLNSLLILTLFAFAAGCGGELPEAPVPDGLAGLSEQDQLAAMGQGVCPVSGEQLGEKGAPIKLDVDGQTVFLCCSNCEEPFNAEREKHLNRANE
jgi:YHS domain-containing protein